MNPNQSVDTTAWRNHIYQHMLRTRGAKYLWFLKYLKLFRLIAKTPERADFLESYYTLMRYLDDIVDEDAPLPQGYTDTESCLLDKIRFAGNPVDPSDESDAMMIHCFQLGNTFGESFTDETEDILGSLLFDARRMEKFRFFRSEELMAHYHQLDIRGTVKATIKLFRENPDDFLLLEPLGMASRFFYDIRDVYDDLSKGLVNISLEDAGAFGITASNINESGNPGIQRWCRAQALRGLQLLDLHRQQIRKGSFRLSTRLTFLFVYERPARGFFNKTLRRTANLEPFTIPDVNTGNYVLKTTHPKRI
ncbi:MAG: hypothetical protein ACKOCO_17575 [Bacteroidota bacterium]